MTDRFELAGDRVVVDGHAVRGVLGHQIDPDHGAGEVLGDQTPDDIGLFDVRADRGELRRRGLEAIDIRCERRRDHVAAGETVFDDLDEAHIRREDRTDARLVDVFDRLGGLGDVLHGLEERLVEHVAVLVHHRDQDAVGAAEVFLIVEKSLHVFVIEWNLFLEAGVHAQLRGEIRHRDRDQREQNQHDDAVAEQQIFGEALEGVGLGGDAGSDHGVSRAYCG